MLARWAFAMVVLSQWQGLAQGKSTKQGGSSWLEVDFEEGQAQKQRPHVVIILADDMGYGDIGYTAKEPICGNLASTGRQVVTPFMDDLVESPGAVKLKHFYVQPSCSPTRMALLTGRYPLRFGFGSVTPIFASPSGPDDDGLPLEEKTIGDALQLLDYHTHIVGKWHLGHATTSYTPASRGFDSFFGHYSAGIDHYTHQVNASMLPKFIRDLSDRQGGIDAYYDLHKETRDEHTGHVTFEMEMDCETYSTDLYTDKAVNLIKDHVSTNGREEPLFLYVAYAAVHAPIQAPPFEACSSKDFGSPQGDYDREGICNMALALDQGISKIKDELEQQNMWDDTLFVFMSDNGGDESFGSSNCNYTGGKGMTEEGGIRAPAFMHLGSHLRGLSFDGPYDSNGMVHIVDIFATAVGAAAISAPHGSGNRNEVLHHVDYVDGINFWKQIQNGDASFGRSELPICAGNKPIPSLGFSVMIKEVDSKERGLHNFKLMCRAKRNNQWWNPKCQLYDLTHDMRELPENNLFRKPRFYDVRREMMGMMHQWEREVSPRDMYLPSAWRRALSLKRECSYPGDCTILPNLNSCALP
ncbi:unnamed protein product, partial [Chrysoparadoxa australica]